MLFTYQTIADSLVCCDTIEEGSWINLINPTEMEINKVVEATGLDYDFLKYALDDEESPRIEVEDDQTLLIINIPIIEKGDILYETIPLGIVLNDDYIVTVCLEDANLFQEITSGRIKDIATFKKTRFIISLFHRKTNLFLRYLRDIHRRNSEIEASLHQSMRNEKLISLLNLQKSLVYFSTSLRANAKVLERLLRGKAVKMYEEDEDLLEDVIIENRQAIEMADVYSNILSSTMNSAAALISNNLTIVMKFLTAITIILAIPTLIASIWGMNVPLPLQHSSYGFLILVLASLLACILGAWFLIKKDMF